MKSVETSGPKSGAAIQKQVLSEALQNPTTLYPVPIGVAALVYAVFVSPFLGFAGTFEAFAIAASSGIFSIGSFYYHYHLRGAESAMAKAQAAIAQEQRAHGEERNKELGDLARSLYGNFHARTSPEARTAFKELQELTREYTDLQPALQAHASDAALPVDQFSALATDTYEAGLRVLEDVLELMRVLEGADKASIEAEIAELQDDIKKLGKSGGNDERIQIKKDTIDSHQKRLDLLSKQQVQVDKLLAQADQCEAELQRLRAELPTLAADLAASGGTAQKSVEALERTISSAREVQRLFSGEAHTKEDEENLRLGRQKTERGR